MGGGRGQQGQHFKFFGSKAAWQESSNKSRSPATNLGCLRPEGEEGGAAAGQHPRAAPRALQHAVGPAGPLLPSQLGQAAQTGVWKVGDSSQIR